MSSSSAFEPRLVPRDDGWPADAVQTVQRLRATVDDLRVQTEQLQHALDSRVVIEQAKGMLSERLGVRPDEAFLLLRRAARSTQTRLHELAEQVVTMRATPAPVARELVRRRREEGC